MHIADEDIGVPHRHWRHWAGYWPAALPTPSAPCSTWPSSGATATRSGRLRAGRRGLPLHRSICWRPALRGNHTDGIKLIARAEPEFAPRPICGPLGHALRPNFATLRFGYAAALSLAMFGLTGVMVAAQWWILRRWWR
jgi:hypothetical protein